MDSLFTLKTNETFAAAFYTTHVFLSLDCIPAVCSQHSHHPTLLHISHLLNAFAVIPTRWDHSCPSDTLECYPCLLSPQSLTHPFHCGYISLFFWRGNHIQYFRYNYWSLTSHSAYLGGTWMTHSKLFLILIWPDQGHMQEPKRRQWAATRYSPLLSVSVLEAPRNARSLEHTYNYICFNTRTPETLFFKYDFSLSMSKPTMTWPAHNSTCRSYLYNISYSTWMRSCFQFNQVVVHTDQEKADGKQAQSHC